jgi:hypothetical protein
MPNTRIAVHEYNQTTKSFVIHGGVTVTGNAWNDCVTALNQANFRPVQHPGQTIRVPAHWSNPGNNVGNVAVSTAYNGAVLGQPHVHGGQGVGHRAAIGYTATAAPAPATHYEVMKIYIGEFS